MKDWVSVLVPCYNGEKFLDSCFNNLLKQLYDKIELVFIDDGSKDKSKEKFFEYSQKFYDRGYKTQYLYQENAGIAAAIQNGLKHLNGEFIFLYDVDDILSDNAISSKANFLIEHKESDLVRSNGYYVKENSIDAPYAEFCNGAKDRKSKKVFYDLIYAKTVNWAGSYMVRAEALFKKLKNKEIYISRYGQNLQMLLPVAYNGKNAYIDEPQIKYVQYVKSDSHSNELERMLELMNGYEENRIEILKMLNIPEKEFRKLIKKINKIYNEKRIKLILNYENDELLSKIYNEIKKSKMNNGKIFFIYHIGKNKVVYTLMKKVKGTIKK